MTIELVNADFSKRVVLATDAFPWLPSPQVHVERRMLDRIGGEVARATTLVRYAAGSSFPAHEHELGEEFLVLEGVFSDEHGDYPTGTYVRNPPGSRHAPRTGPGCIIFVKLRQMRSDDRQRVVIDTRSSTWERGDTAGHSRLPLYAKAGDEMVDLQRLEAGRALPPYECADGEEILLLEGQLEDEHGSYAAGCWIRNPAGHRHRLGSTIGACFWSKRSHLTAKD